MSNIPQASLSSGFSPAVSPTSTYSGPVPANGPASGANVNDLYRALHGFSWRSVGFPVTEFDTELSQDDVVHKFVDRDGAHVEGIGRAALVITAHIPFVNGIRPGPNESFGFSGGAALYPFVWHSFFAVCAQKGSGTLLHPELGPLTCKLRTFKTTWRGTERGGPVGVATWIESDDTGIDLDSYIATASPSAQVSIAAADADTDTGAALANFGGPVPKLPTFSSSFTDLANSIRAVIDLPSLLANQYGGQINAILYQAQTLEDALNEQGNRNALNWPLFQAAESMKSAAYDLQQTIITKGRPVGLYTTVGDQSLSQIAMGIPANIADIMTLNPGLVQNPIVLNGTVVRYYRAAA